MKPALRAWLQQVARALERERACLDCQTLKLIETPDGRKRICPAHRRERRALLDMKPV